MTGPFKSERRALAELRRFTFDYDSRTDPLPKGVDPALVLGFVADELRFALPAPLVARQVVELADYYDLRSLAADMRRFLVTDAAQPRMVPSDADFDARLALARGAAILGGGPERSAARSAFRELVSLPRAAFRMADLFATFIELWPDEEASTLATRLGALVSELRASTEPSARMRARALGDLLRGELPWLVRAAERRSEILGLPALDVRLDRCADIYLGLDLDYHAWLERWAVRVILRSAAAEGDAPVAAAFARALARIAVAIPDVGERAPMHARASHALARFGGAARSRALRAARTSATPFELLSAD